MLNGSVCVRKMH